MRASRHAVWIPDKLQFLLNRKARYKVAYGGRGGAKSRSFATALILLCYSFRRRVVCGRELQNSLADSVYQLLVDTIGRLGLERYFYITKESIACTRTGSTIIFKGIKNNVDAIKSLEDADIIWLEEADKISKNSWEKIIPTMRKPGSEIWVSFNPENEDDPTYQMFVAREPPPNSIVVKIGWEDIRPVRPPAGGVSRLPRGGWAGKRAPSSVLSRWGRRPSTGLTNGVS